MKVAIATDDYRSISGHVGRCKGFLIITVENGEIKKKESRGNIFTKHVRERDHHHDGKMNGYQGHGKLVAGISDCSHLICHGCGWRLVEDLKQAGIKPVAVQETDAETAAIKLEKGELESDYNLICKSG